MSKNVFAQLKASYGYMSRVERRIADLIISRPEQFVTLTMAQLSQQEDVSQGSINNFARKFFSCGFSALKLQVAACIGQDAPSPLPIAEAQDVKSVMDVVLKGAVKSFTDTIHLNSEDTLAQVVHRILRARRIDIYGVYHSGITARDLCFQLINLGIPANYVEDPFMCGVSASTLDENALVIAISASGRTTDIVDAVQIARENHTPVICLTTNPYSPLAKISDSVLLSASLDPEDLDRAGMLRMAQLFVVDSLTRCLRSTIKDDPVNRDRLKKFSLSHSITD